MEKDETVALSDAMSEADMEYTINDAWQTPGNITPRTDGPVRRAVLLAMKRLDSGKMRVAEPMTDGGWHVNQWLKKAILMYFKMHREQEITGGPDKTVWWDKVPSKFQRWDFRLFAESRFRTVPGSFVRYSAFIGRNAVLMPSFVNVGAYIDEGTMIDTWVTVGSCAQIGKNCHISGGVGIGGVLEPLQASPVIIEDNVFVGARSEIAEGVIVQRGAVISMGVFLGASTKIIDRETGEIFQGRVPPYSVVVPGSLPGRPLPDGSPGPNLSCAVIVKRVDEQTRSKTSINEILRGA